MSGVREFVFYLSTSPALYGPICENLKAAGLRARQQPRGGGKADRPRPRQLSPDQRRAGRIFSEDRIFRIDHYLGKETVQNLLALRFANTLFEPLWNKVSIDHVQITVAETIGVEGRWSYYDDYGALRDMVQNHLLQLLCLVAMEPPAASMPNSVRDEKVKVLRSLQADRRPRRSSAAPCAASTAPASPRAASVPGYPEETGGRESDTETFVALCAPISTTGAGPACRSTCAPASACRARSSQIVIQFRHVPHSIFPAPATCSPTG